MFTADLRLIGDQNSSLRPVLTSSPPHFDVLHQPHLPRPEMSTKLAEVSVATVQSGLALLYPGSGWSLLEAAWTTDSNGSGWTGKKDAYTLYPVLRFIQVNQVQARRLPPYHPGPSHMRSKLSRRGRNEITFLVWSSGRQTERPRYQLRLHYLWDESRPEGLFDIILVCRLSAGTLAAQ